MQFLTFPITHTAGDAGRLPGSWRGGKGIAVVAVRSKSELQTPATDDAAVVVSDTCICGGGGGGGPAEGRLRKVEIGSARSNDEPSHRRDCITTPLTPHTNISPTSATA